MTGYPSFIPYVLGSYLDKTWCWALGQVQGEQQSQVQSQRERMQEGFLEEEAQTWVAKDE